MVLSLFSSGKERVKREVQKEIQAGDHGYQENGNDDQGGSGIDAQLLCHQVQCTGGQFVEDDDAQQHGDTAAVGLGQQNGHAEQFLLIKSVEHEQSVDGTGKHVHRKTCKERQDRQYVTQEDGSDTAQDRNQLLECQVISAAMAPDNEDHLQQNRTDQNKQYVDMPVVVIHELDGSSGLDNFRQGNEETGDAVEEKQYQREGQPYIAGIVAVLIQEILQEPEVSVGDQHHAQQGNVMPEVDSGPQAHTHADGTAGPEDHDHKQYDKGTDYFFCLFGGNKCQQQEQIAEYGND